MEQELLEKAFDKLNENMNDNQDIFILQSIALTNKGIENNTLEAIEIMKEYKDEFVSKDTAIKAMFENNDPSFIFKLASSVDVIKSDFEDNRDIANPNINNNKELKEHINNCGFVALSKIIKDDGIFKKDAYIVIDPKDEVFYKIDKGDLKQLCVNKDYQLIKRECGQLLDKNKSYTYSRNALEKLENANLENKVKAQVEKELARLKIEKEMELENYNRNKNEKLNLIKKIKIKTRIHPEATKKEIEKYKGEDKKLAQAIMEEVLKDKNVKQADIFDQYFSKNMVNSNCLEDICGKIEKASDLIKKQEQEFQKIEAQKIIDAENEAKEIKRKEKEEAKEQGVFNFKPKRRNKM